MRPWQGGQSTQYSSAWGSAMAGLLRNTRQPRRGLLVPAPPPSPARIGKDKGKPIRREPCPLVVAISSAGHPLALPRTGRPRVASGGRPSDASSPPAFLATIGKAPLGVWRGADDAGRWADRRQDPWPAEQITPMQGRYLWRGFTLVELLVVVTILGILVAMVVPRLAGRTQQARVARAEADVKANLALALDLFELDNGRYPTTEEGLNALRIKPPDATNWNGPYLKRDALDPWGHPYRYRYPGAQNPADYDLSSLGPDGSEGTPDDIVSWKAAA